MSDLSNECIRSLEITISLANGPPKLNTKRKEEYY